MAEHRPNRLHIRGFDQNDDRIAFNISTLRGDMYRSLSGFSRTYFATTARCSTSVDSRSHVFERALGQALILGFAARVRDAGRARRRAGTVYGVGDQHLGASRTSPILRGNGDPNAAWREVPDRRLTFRNCRRVKRAV